MEMVTCYKISERSRSRIERETWPRYVSGAAETNAESSENSLISSVY